MVFALCDDDQIWMKQAAEFIKEYAEKNKLLIELLLFDNGKDLLDYTANVIDVVFMDIELEMENGIETAARINRQWKDCQIVYCTNYLHYAIDVYETKHTWFMVKSQMKDRFDNIIKRLMYIKSLEKQEVYYHVIRGEITRFLVKDILYFERQTRFTLLVTKEATFRIREKITEVMNDLPEGMFTRCHSSFTVNLEQIVKKNGTFYELSTGEKLPISRSFSQSTKNDYLRWCAEQMN